MLNKHIHVYMISYMEGNMTDLEIEYEMLQWELKKLAIKMENTPILAKGYKEMLRKEIDLTKMLQDLMNRMINE